MDRKGLMGRHHEGTGHSRLVMGALPLVALVGSVGVGSALMSNDAPLDAAAAAPSVGPGLPAGVLTPNGAPLVIGGTAMSLPAPGITPAPVDVTADSASGGARSGSSDGTVSASRGGSATGTAVSSAVARASSGRSAVASTGGSGSHGGSSGGGVSSGGSAGSGGSSGGGSSSPSSSSSDSGRSGGLLGGVTDTVGSVAPSVLSFDRDSSSVLSFG